MHKVAFKLVRSRRRTIALTVSTDQEVTVRAPLRMPKLFIEEFVEEKREWLRRTLEYMGSRPKAPKKTFADGEPFLYMGNPYPLSIVPGRGLRLEERGFMLGAESRSRAKEAFAAWYREEARRELTVLTEQYAKMFKHRYRRIRITGARHRWGSCSVRGNINFAWRLIMAPRFVCEYVVAHELAHLRHHNHGAAFWNEVQRMFSRTDEARAWLKDHSRFMTL